MMCAVSMIGDLTGRQWGQGIGLGGGSIPLVPAEPSPGYVPGTSATVTWTSPTRAEFDQLKKEVEFVKDLLMRAKKFDEETGQPDCEMDEKVAIIKKVADLVGVSMDEVFKK